MNSSAPPPEKPPAITADNETIARITVQVACTTSSALVGAAHGQDKDATRLVDIYQRVAWHFTELANMLQNPNVLKVLDETLEHELEAAERIAAAKQQREL